MARRLADGVATIAGVELAYPVEANGVFAALPPGGDRGAAGATIRSTCGTRRPGWCGGWPRSTPRRRTSTVWSGPSPKRWARRSRANGFGGRVLMSACSGGTPGPGGPANAWAIDIHSLARSPEIDRSVSATWRRWVTTRQKSRADPSMVDHTPSAPPPSSRPRRRHLPTPRFPRRSRQCRHRSGRPGRRGPAPGT